MENFNAFQATLSTQDSLQEGVGWSLHCFTQRLLEILVS